MFNIKRKNEFSEEKCSVFLNRQNKNAPGIPGRSCLKRKEKKLKYFEGVHRSVWALRCVSYEIYQLLADTSILYPTYVLEICMKPKKSIKNIKSIISQRKKWSFLITTKKNRTLRGDRSVLLKRKEKKLKYFEGVHRSVWTLRCVSYEMYQLFAATVLLYPENVSKICSSDKEYMNSGERGKSPFQLKGSWV